MLNHIVYGMFGCWQPAFEHQLVYVLHIKIPTFDPSTKKEEAINDVCEACAKLQKRHVWHAIADLHCSDLDGQRLQDWHQNTHGFHAMCKFMVNANAQMADFEKKTFCKKLDQDKLMDA